MDGINSDSEVGFAEVGGVVSMGSVPVYWTVVKLRCDVDAGVEELWGVS